MARAASLRSIRALGRRAIGIALVLFAAGCGDDGKEGGLIVVPAPSPTTTPVPTPTATSTPGAGRVVVEFDFRTTVAP